MKNESKHGNGLQKSEKPKGKAPPLKDFFIVAVVFILISISCKETTPRAKRNSEIDKEQISPESKNHFVSVEEHQRLTYRIVERQDISYAGTPRMVFRVLVDVNTVPLDNQLKQISMRIWEKANGRWKEFTVFIYLPDMDISHVAYAIAEFRPQGLSSFKVQDSALYGTRWKPIEQEKKKANEKWERQKKSTTVKEYQIMLEVRKVKPRQVRVDIRTDFPDRTYLHVWVNRTYYEKGKPERYAGEIFSKDIAVKDGQIDLLVDIDDSGWYGEYYEKARKFKGLIDFPGIVRISGNIEVSVLFSPMRNQPEDVLRILGTKGEFIKGAGAERSGNFTVYRVEKELDIPFTK